MKSVFKQAWPYQTDALNLPVVNLEAAIPFYKAILGFRVVSQTKLPYQSAILERDGIQIGLAENGGDPAQDGCFFEVDNVERAFAEFKANGLQKENPDFTMQHYQDSFKVFFIVAPDGLCYCLGERQL
jgi:lactoylglutathione lyase